MFGNGLNRPKTSNQGQIHTYRNEGSQEVTNENSDYQEFKELHMIVHLIIIAVKELNAVTLMVKATLFIHISSGGGRIFIDQS